MSSVYSIKGFEAFVDLAKEVNKKNSKYFYVKFVWRMMFSPVFVCSSESLINRL